jgi:cell wall-associated NlpC family hydrolase
MRYFLISLFLITFAFHTIFAQQDSITNSDSVTLKLNTDSLIGFAKQYLGLKYRYGGNTPAGFDCSGFTGYVFAHFGYKLYRSARDQYNNGVLITREEAQPCDLIFFRERNRNGSYRISHVGLIISVDTVNSSFRFIHSCRRGILIDNSDYEYYKKRFYGIRRVIER